jgi:hypothetical protein
MGQKVITNQKTQKYKVVYNSLKIVIFDIDIFKLEFEVLSDHSNLYELEFDSFCQLDFWLSSAFKTHVALLLTFVADLFLDCHDTFSEYKEVSFVRAQTQHDQVRISSINAVLYIWVVGGLCTLRTDKIQNFMFSLAWNERIRENKDKIFPKRVTIGAFNQILLEGY